MPRKIGSLHLQNVYNSFLFMMYILYYFLYFSLNTSNCLQSTEVTTSDKNVVKFDQNQQNVQFVFDTWKVGNF